MKTTQIVFLGVAVAAGAAAFMMTGESKSPAPVVMAPAAAKIETDEVLVAAHDISMGSQVGSGDLAWRIWPKASISHEMITRTGQPNAMQALDGSVARSSMIEGETILAGKLVKGTSSGLLAAILPPGERAVAINIDSQGATTAGGFIIPNDRVDVLRTSRDDEASKAGAGDAYRTDTILSNIRVLAIGQNIQEKNNEKVVVGSNATLEVSPREAEILVEAQRVGQLSLSLRSVRDADAASSPIPKDRGITVVRYGVALTTSQN
jgi:pilus assembly protein CpaB